MAGLLGKLIFRTRVVTTWIDSLPLRGHCLLLPITAQPDCVSGRRRNYHSSPIWLQKHVATAVDGASSGHELTAEERRRIDELWKSQESLGVIAETMNKRLSVVWKYLVGSAHRTRPMSEWTDDEHNKLLELRKQGYSYRKFAEKLGRSYLATTAYVDRIRCTSVAGHTTVYSLEQRDQAVALLRQGLKPPSIAEGLGLPVRVIAHMLRRRQSRRQWTTEDVEKLLSLKEAGSSWREIQVVLSGPNETAIKTLYSHLALAKHCPRLGSAKLASVPWSPEEDAKLRRLRNVHRLRFDDIAQQLPGRSPSAIRSRYLSIDASLKGVLGYTERDLGEIARLRAAGSSWQDMVGHFPDRTALALKKTFYKECSGKYSVDERGDITWHEIPSHSKAYESKPSS